MAGRKPRRARRWLGGAALLLSLVGGIAAWWQAGEWMPSRARYPIQGAETSAADGAVNWVALKASGADFAYLDASAGADVRDPAFTEGLAEARAAGLKVGAVHHYDPCRGAGEQAANFVTVVPRDAALLPPAVELDLDEAECAAPPAPAAMVSELTTFLNQIEGHVGKPAILKLSPAFEARYRLAPMLDRNLWLTGDYLAPGYAGRPWVMWTANTRLRSPAVDGRLRWIAVRP
jgi:lysozyme